MTEEKGSYDVDEGQLAPRVTRRDIEEQIIAETFFTAAEGGIGAYRTHGDVYQGRGEIHHDSLGLMTICVLVLRNGFTVLGKSACASPSNFDAGEGRQAAYEDAIREAWPLLGYALKDRLAG